MYLLSVLVASLLSFGQHSISPNQANMLPQLLSMGDCKWVNPDGIVMKEAATQVVSGLCDTAPAGSTEINHLCVGNVQCNLVELDLDVTLQNVICTRDPNGSCSPSQCASASRLPHSFQRSDKKEYFFELRDYSKNWSNSSSIDEISETVKAKTTTK